MAMRAYTVHAPPEAPAAPERFAFVKDGFSWPALFVPIIWILWQRLWLTLMGYVIFVLVVAWIELLVGTGYAMLVGLLGSILFALEANNICRLSLDRRGWRDLGSSFGQNLDEAEIRFFQKWVEGGSRVQPAERREAIARTTFQPTRASDADEPILGLFPEPER
jgi:hypothetical protein